MTHILFKKNLKNEIEISGAPSQWQTQDFPGATTPKVSVKSYYLVNFPQKNLMKIKKLKSKVIVLSSCQLLSKPNLHFPEMLILAGWPFHTVVIGLESCGILNFASIH